MHVVLRIDITWPLWKSVLYTKRNILVLITDPERMGDVSALNEPQIYTLYQELSEVLRTPNTFLFALDALL